MRGFFWLWIMFLLLCLVTDSAAYWVTRQRLSQSLLFALDGALVAAVEEKDLIWGRNLGDRGKAEAWARQLFYQNMGGHSPENLTLTFSLGQEGERITAQGEAGAKIPFLLAGMINADTRIVVNKRLDYQGQYK